MVGARTQVASLIALLARYRAAILAGAGAAIVLVVHYLTPGWLERMWTIVLPAIWTVVVIRLLSARATLPAGVLGNALAIGVLIAVFVVPMASRLPNPYGASGAWYDLLGAVARLAALLAPVAVVLLSGRLFRLLSVADAFLLGFAIGFGFDLTALLLSGDGARAPFPIAFVPPFEIPVGRRSMAGSAYWTGLVMLTLAAGLRFRPALARLIRLGPRWSLAIPIVLTALVFLWCATEAAALFIAAPTGWMKTVLVVGRDGSLTAFVALAALLALSWAEARWVQAARPQDGSWTEDLRNVLGALARLDLRETARAIAVLRLRGQLRIAEAEKSQAPDDETLLTQARAAATRLQEVQTVTATTAPPPAPARGWRDPAVILALGWLVLILALFLIPRSRYLSAFWSIPILHMRVGTTQLTLFTLALAVLLIARFIRAMPQADPPGDPGEIAEYRLEQAVLGLGLAVVTVVALYASADGALSLYNPAVAFSGRLAQPGRPLLLLFAVAATGVAVPRAFRWTSAPISARRRGVVHHTMAVVVAIVLLWLPLAVYPQTVVALHAALGPTLKPRFVRLYGTGHDMAAGLATSNVIAALAAVVVTTVVIVAVIGLHAWSKRVEGFLMDPDEGERA